MKYAVNENSRDGERGAVKIKTVLILFVAAVVVFLVIKIAPVYVEQREIVYQVDELARLAAVRGWKEDKINQDIEKLRNEYGLPEKSINLVADDKLIKITLGYTRAIDLLVTTYEWKVEYTATGKEL